MVPYEHEEFIDNLIELVNEGKVSIDRIDDAVSKILKLKFELDLFENPSTNPADYNDFVGFKIWLINLLLKPLHYLKIVMKYYH